MSLATRVDRVMAQTSPDSVEAFETKTLEEMGNYRVAFGKAHVGKSFSEMWETEKSWMKWFIRTYSDSHRDEHRKLIIYVEKMVQKHEVENGLPEIQQAVVMPRCKMQPKAKSQRSQMTQAQIDAMTVMSEEPLDPWDVMEPTTSIHEDMISMQNRVCAMENAVTEILSLLRPAQPGMQ